MTTRSSSVTDQPIHSIAEEALDIRDYAESLVEFIDHCATPLTIGIQGEWGSGKTSVMYMMVELLKQRSRIGTAWVNTWEHSMFRTAQEITPGVLGGLLADLKENAVNASSISESLEPYTKAMKALGRIALNAAGNATIGVGAGEIVDAVGGGNSPDSVAALKGHLHELIGNLVSDRSNAYEAFVFFVDDLDRINPTVAVEVLEALKNLFDLPHCVFILAIDYEVVVKGLEEKFGPKTDENEREFRSFFDKIIQVPFSMPVNVYKVDNLIQAKFDDLGLGIDLSMETAFAEVVRLTIGSNPRSVKRFINTFSLLRQIGVRKAGRDVDGSLPQPDDLALFFMIGMQIAYPRIYNLLTKDPDFVTWNGDLAFSQGAKMTEPTEAQKADKLMDEEWEQVVWAICQSQRDAYLKRRARPVLEVLNLIRDRFESDLPERLGGALSMTSITSVDSEEVSEPKKNKKFHFDAIDGHLEAKRAYGIPELVLKVMRGIHDDILTTYSARGAIVKYSRSAVSFHGDVPGRKKLFAYIDARKKVVRVWVNEAIEAGSLKDTHYDLATLEHYNAEVQSAVEKSMDLLMRYSRQS